MKKSASFIFAIALAACGGDNEASTTDERNGTDTDTRAEQGPDTTSPSVISITPADGSTGVLADTPVLIEFSEAMDRLTVQDSLDTADLAGVSFEWSTDGTTVTIVPDESLPYAEAGNLDVEALSYTVSVGTAAEDLAGNSLAFGATTKFTTLRAITQNMDPIAAMTGSCKPTGPVEMNQGYVFIGDDGEGGTASGVRGLLTFDLSPIPAEAFAIDRAALHAEDVVHTGNAFLELGALLADHLTYELTGDSFENATDNDCNSAYNQTSSTAAINFIGTEDEFLPSVDVTDWVAQDFAQRTDREDRSQFRLRHFEDLNLDQEIDGTEISNNDATYIRVTYLVP